MQSQTKSVTSSQLHAYLSAALLKLQEAETLVGTEPDFHFNDITRINDLVDGVQSALNDLCDLEP